MAVTQFLLISSLVLGLVRAVPQGQQQSICTDGGQARCCGVTFNGDNVPIDLLSALGCYDLTPASTNCFLTGTPDPSTGLCPGNRVPHCCQIPLDPLIGLYCGPAPGPCQGPEAPPRCLDFLGDRFGHCPGINPGTGRLVASQFGDAAAANPLGLDVSPLLSGIIGNEDSKV